ncbi:MAG: D-glycero-beta-D-manno-heptose 1-phosphate adenylyltransferase [Bacteroidetes bacterium]|nr:MAG: D-glycero-beta-D-manno-heptose 1-phosphate adenylyltransferase [Bacteroidota bacterium]
MTVHRNFKTKVITPEDAGKILTPSFRNNHVIVFTNGCFDLLHRGHIHYLSRAREMGDLLLVGLNTDASVSRLKGPGRPVAGEHSRAEVLASLMFVDYVLFFDEDTPLDLIRILRPDILVKGGDYKPEEIAGYREVLSWGGQVEVIPLLEGYSTSSLIRRIGG